MTYIPGRTIPQMAEEARELDTRKADYRVPVAGIHFMDDGRLSVQEHVGGSADATVTTVLVPTRHALSQIFAKLGPAAWGKGANRSLPADFLLSIPKDWLALNLNRAIRGLDEKNGWTVRASEYEDQEATCRAVMDRHYYDFDNVDMLALIDKVMTEKPAEHRISPQSFVDPDAMRVDIILGYKKTRPDGGGNDEWSWGFGVRNDEIGRGTGGAYCVVKRGKCDNSVAVDLDGFNYTFRHWAKNEATKARYKTELAVAIGNLVPHAEELIETMLEADFRELPDFSELVRGMSIANQWDPNTAGQIWEGAEGQHTLGGLVNGVSHAAKAMEPAARFDTELLAGAILVTPDSVFSAAYNAIEQDEREKAAAQKREARKAARAR